MAEFTVNPTRFDPYKSHMFRVKWDGVYVAGLSKMSPLKRSTAPVTHRVGGDPSHDRKSPGLTTLRRGHPRARRHPRPGLRGMGQQGEQPRQPGISLKDFRKDLIVDVFNEAGQKVISYKLFRCWVSEYQALPAPRRRDRRGRDPEHQDRARGWERDTAVTEPAEQAV